MIRFSRRGALPSAVAVLMVGHRPVGAAIGNLLAWHGAQLMVINKAAGIFMALRAIALDDEASTRNRAEACTPARNRGRRLRLARCDSRENLDAVLLRGWYRSARPRSRSASGLLQTTVR